MKKILVVTPRFPVPDTGACSHDRLQGIVQLRRLGYDVRVLTKCISREHEEQTRAFGKESGIPVTTSLYTKKVLSKSARFLRYVERVFVPWWWDGAAFEFRDKEIQDLFIRELDVFKPDLVWFDYTFLWPLYKHAEKRNIPTVTRSINFEPSHFLDEDGRSPLNYLKYVAKLLSEYRMLWKSTVVLSINPNEGERYKKMGGKHVFNLPLRGLPLLPRTQHEIRKQTPLKIVFMGSTYNVPHNRDGLLFLLREVIPLVQKEHPGDFEFHVTGSKMPEELLRVFNGHDVVYNGFVENLDAFLETMDIAVVPSLYGAGMQQKIFEPLFRGLPTLTHTRGIAGYPFKDGEHYLSGDTAASFVRALATLKNADVRKRLSTNAQKLSHALFSQEHIDTLVQEALRACL